jgi:prepilin-type processing-associated H-X9-DG protein
LHPYDFSAQYAAGQPDPLLNANTFLNFSLPSVESQVKSFLCPSDPGNQAPQLDLSFQEIDPAPVTPFTGIDGFPLRAVGVTNYYAITGQNWGGPGLCCNGGTDPRFIWPAAGTTIPASGACTTCDGAGAGDGVFYLEWENNWWPAVSVDNRSGNRITDIADGTSNTFMIGEALVRPGYPVAWAHAFSAFRTCGIYPNAKQPDGTPFPGGGAGWPNTHGLSSNHQGGVQIAFADGSVHFVSDSMDFGIYRAMATIRGGEIAQLP